MLDKDALLALHEKYGSWSAASRAIKVRPGTLQQWVAIAGLIGIDSSRARSRLPDAHAWIHDREELRRRLQAHGNLSATSEAEGMGRATLERAVAKHGLQPDEWIPNPADFGVKRYDQPIVLDGDWAIASDFQAPYTAQHLVALLCKLSRAWGIKNLLIAGDFIDLDIFSKHDPMDELPPWEDVKTFAQNLVKVLRQAFSGRILWIMGNHELRLARVSRGKWSMNELASVLEAISQGIEPIMAPSVQLSASTGVWDVVHPASFSVIPTAVAKDLAIKTQHHQIVAHGHQVGYRRDPSGQLRCIDTGAMCDRGLLAYVNLRPTRHPIMRQGFTLFRNGHAYLIEPDADIEFWMRAGKP